MTHSPTDPETTQPEAEIKVPCEVYSRIVGYLRPIQNWHEGKQQEFKERKTFQVPEAGPQEEPSR
jgi:anaerobic ribonucleoside-triphosphate reductase